MYNSSTVLLFGNRIPSVHSEAYRMRRKHHLPCKTKLSRAYRNPSHLLRVFTGSHCDYDSTEFQACTRQNIGCVEGITYHAKQDFHQTEFLSTFGLVFSGPTGKR
uniref:Uncharacterized protein n=1 Tax=Physcomitrium patens TaxID=3218 RepID=A0A2K1IBI7_PHYPA|nr:hypothetical protein PHYPA_030131 [Physcomitrium patens]